MTKAEMTTGKPTSGMVRDTKFETVAWRNDGELQRRSRLLTQLCKPYNPLKFLS